ncbi:hypothetical protein ABIB06_007342 [Bradyrhizobium sp. LB8.2]|uniref:hypothetical protein n=1 Tax=unclassified Bradyrhizobium TaxID=2631580 RepID=UPI003396CED8
MRSLVLAVVFGLVASTAVAQDWGKFATISSTMGVSASRLCLGDASRGDIGCPSYAPYVNSSGFVGIGTTAASSTLYVSGTGWVGNTSSSINLQDDLYLGHSYSYGYSPNLSIQTMGTTWATTNFQGDLGQGQFYFSRNSGGNTVLMMGLRSADYMGTVFNLYPVSATMTSATTVSGTPYAAINQSGTSYISTSGILIGPNAASRSAATALEVNGTISATNFVGNGSGLTGIAGASADRIVSGTTSMLAISNTGYVSLTQSGVNTGWFDPARGLVTIGVSSTGPISGTDGYFSGNVGIGMPVSTNYGLQVSGTAGLWAQGNNPSAVVRTPGATSGLKTSFYAGRGAVAAVFTANPSNSGASTEVTIAGGTSTGNSYLSFDKASPTTVNAPGSIGYDLANNAMALNVNSSNAITIVSSGFVGIGTNQPSTTLHVMGGAILAKPNSPLYYQNDLGVGQINNANTPNFYLQSIGSSSYAYMRLAAQRFGATYDIDRADSNIHGNANLMRVSGATFASTTFALYPTGASITSASVIVSSPYVALNEGANSYYNGNGNLGVGTTSPNAKLEVSGTISATNFVGNGSGLTGIASTGDRIVSGSVNMVAEQTSGTVRVSGTLAMVNTGNEVCNAATWYSFRVNPNTGMMQMCRP